MVKLSFEHKMLLTHTHTHTETNLKPKFLKCNNALSNRMVTLHHKVNDRPKKNSLHTNV